VNADPVDRVLELLTDRHLTREHVHDAVQLLDGVRARMLERSIDATGIFAAIGEAVRLLDVALGLPPDDEAAT
jgi:hypothetical protein